MGGRAFLCQISEGDWYISRLIGVYGNREGSERKGEVQYFGDTSPTVQSIIEDLVGMRKGDLVFFHVLRKNEESSIHGVYRVREEPFFNEQRLWKSEHFIYPYRFCFEPHPEHITLCKYDASIAVNQFYASVEIGEIRLIVTLEREERGAAHAVKMIAREDAKKIIEALYREFPTRRLQHPLKFEPLKISGPHLRNYIKRVGEIEFALKAVVAYKLGQGDPDFTHFIPACRYGQYDFLIQTFIGQTIRRPVDLVCIGYGNSERTLTIIEVKRDIAKIDDLVQLLNYQEILRIRDIECSNLNFSACLLARRFQPELVNYCHLRNLFIPWEEAVLLSYTPTSNGTDANFTIQTLPEDAQPSIPQKGHPKIGIDISQIHSNPEEFYYKLGREITPRTGIEISSTNKNVTILRKYYMSNSLKTTLGYILIYTVPATCEIKDFIEFMRKLYVEANKLKGKFIMVEPVIIAKDYENLITLFIEHYNNLEKRALRKPISTYMLV